LKKHAGLGGAQVTVDTQTEHGIFATIPVATPALQPDDLAALSRDFGEAFSIQVHSVADLVIYDHFRDGERARGITFAGEAGWIRVVGAPEAWEAGYFFAPAKLATLLEELADDCSDDAVLERDGAELKRLFAGGKLEEGNPRPVVQWRSLAQAITRHYGLAEPVVGTSTSSMKIPQTKPQ
jgi:hypothetical protein